MDLRITTTTAILDIHRTPGKLEIQQPKADMEMDIQEPRLQIHTEHGQVIIDQSQCFAESGLKNPFDLTRDFAAFSRNKLLQTIEKITRQGNELSSIHNRYDPIPMQAEENAYIWDQVEFNIETMPKSRPEIDFKGGTVNIEVVEGKVNLSVRINKPIINFTYGKIDHYLKQKNSIQVEYVGKNLNKSV